MPKMKTNSAAKKRFKLSAGGKVLRRRAFRTHYLEAMTSKRRRHKRRVAGIEHDAREILRMLGKR
jgi:large subunit ribosomal protein L35